VKVVVSHNKPDFDALASLALARLLHPGSVAVLLGSLDSQVAAFVHLYRDPLKLIEAAEIALERVSELIVVDTADSKRIAPFDQLLGQVPVTLYDHHPLPANPIPAGKGLHQPVGATATILTLLLKANGIVIPQELASLALLGIHEDTGNLSFSLTRPEDHEAAAHLLRAGASLSLVQEFSVEHYTPEHRELFAQLLQEAAEQTLGGRHVVVAGLKHGPYLPGIAPLCNQLLALHGADAALLAAEMEGKTLLIARAKEGTIDVGAALAEAFDGGGHAGAAFARSDLPLEAVLPRALAAFERHAQAGLRARDLMSAPVHTVPGSASIAEAGALLTRYGYNGLPVVNHRGQLVGIISRRDLERAQRHGLGEARVRGFMTKRVISATEETSQAELEALIQRHNIGRIPILRGSKLVGIVTRTDLIGAHHNEPGRLSGEEKALQRLLSSLPSAAHAAIEAAKPRLSGALYVVGGTVRDALLHTGMQDLDLVVEGESAEQLGSALQQALGGKLSAHLGFGTCTLTLPSGLVIDLATAREEFYRHPGALPDVTPSTLHKDLSRRDFTVNALAVRVWPEPARLFDPYSGLADLDGRVLRPLHPLSFVEDPTRILRGARLAGRLGFTFHPDADERIRVALSPSVLGKISKSRLRSELQLTLAEPRVTPAIKLLARYSALEQMFQMQLDEGALSQLDALRQQGPVPDESYLLLLLLSVPDNKLVRHRQAFHWPRRLLELRGLLQTAQRHNAIAGERLAELPIAVTTVLKVLSRKLREQVERFEASPQRRKLRGQDVLELGLKPGPSVGKVLAEVAKAREVGAVASFEAELALASHLVDQLQE